MLKEKTETLLPFYIDQLKNDILPYWERMGIDREFGAYYTCISNDGSKLLSTDKYTWSQGRVVWLFSKLSKMDCFSEDEQEKFLKLAREGAYFLMDHCRLENGNCTFVMERDGTPKPMHPGEELDISINADEFAVLGVSRYAAETGDKTAYEFAKELYKSMKSRLDSGNFKSYPYPEPEGYKMHGKIMGLLNITEEMANAALKVGDPEYADYAKIADDSMNYIMDNFVDENFALHEMKTFDGRFEENTLFGRYVNPGHTIEDMWFIIHNALRSNNSNIIAKACKVLEKTFNIGWDTECGGIQLFADKDGGRPRGDITGFEKEEMARKVMNDWSNKLWWPHSESLYSTLLAYYLTGEEKFFDLYEKVQEYTFRVFPNPDKNIGEWIQIRDRYGKPETKVVALPVKDPFHIMRNFILIIDLLETAQKDGNLADIAV